MMYKEASMHHLFKHGLSMLIGGLVVVAVLVATQASAQEQPAADAATAAEAATAVEAAAPVAPVLSYQGQLLDPFTNAPKPNGLYAMTFAIYTASAGGTPQWGETKSVVVNDGLFSTLLGDVAPLNLAIFNGQPLFLGVKVGTDPEATPRQRLAYTPYSLYAGNADTLDGLDSTAFVRTGQGGGGGSAIAFGFVDTDGERVSGTDNWTSEWRDDQDFYLIDIDNEDYDYREYVTVVTPTCGFPRIPNTGSGEDKLVVEFFSPGGNRETCRFHFVVFKP
jgi:hypothetical protein